jgi:hypothetical protein
MPYVFLTSRFTITFDHFTPTGKKQGFFTFSGIEIDLTWHTITTWQ